MARSRFDHLGTIDPAGVAKRLGADGYGIVWAVVGTGIEGTHPHFLRYENLVLTPPVRHRDFTIALAASEGDPLQQASLDDATLAEEALLDGQGNGTHTAGVIAGVSNIEDHLQDIYMNQTEILVVFLSAEYATKEWTGLEWRVVRDIIKRKQSRTVMPIRFDATEVPGLFSTDGYVSAIEREPEDIADLVLDRLELNRTQGR